MSESGDTHLKSPKTALKSSGRDSPSGSSPSSPSRKLKSPRTTVRRRAPPQIPTVPRLQARSTFTHPTSSLPASSPPQEASSAAQTRPTQAGRPQAQARDVPLAHTLDLLLTPLRILLAPLHIILSPIYAHLINGLIILSIASAGVLFVLPLLPSFLLRVLGKSFRFLSNDFLSRSFGLGLGESDINLGSDILLLPARTIATPACLLAGLFCQTSLLSKHNNGSTIVAKPFWAWREAAAEDAVDVGQVARALTQEVRGARDIFDSVRLLGEGSLAGGLEYVKIWELAVAVGTGSTLEDRGLISAQLTELGDMTRDLSDEISHIDSITVNAFGWLQWEFSDLVRLLSSPSTSRPNPEILSRKLHSLLLRLSEALDSIHALTSGSARHASEASAHGQGLYTHLSRTKSSLKSQKDKEPGWKREADKVAHFFVGGELSKSELIDRDLKITTNTIGNVRALSTRLEETRTKVKVFRDQIGMFDASMMGFHLGASEDAGLGPEEEVRILNSVVEELGRAVGTAKGGRGRGGENRFLEID